MECRAKVASEIENYKTSVNWFRLAVTPVHWEHLSAAVDTFISRNMDLYGAVTSSQERIHDINPKLSLNVNPVGNEKIIYETDPLVEKKSGNK